MDPEVWRRVSDLFSECLTLPESDRTTFLAKVETSDSAIAAEIRKLLETASSDPLCATLSDLPRNRYPPGLRANASTP